MKLDLTDYIIIGFGIFAVLFILAVPAFADFTLTIDEKTRAEESIRVCIFEDIDVYCERIMGTIPNTERIIETFYHSNKIYDAFKHQHDNNWISDSNYIRVLEFGLDYVFTYDWVKERFELNSNYLPTDYNDSASYRELDYMRNWDAIKASADFDDNWSKKR